MPCSVPSISPEMFQLTASSLWRHVFLNPRLQVNPKSFVLSLLSLWRCLRLQEHISPYCTLFSRKISYISSLLRQVFLNPLLPIQSQFIPYLFSLEAHHTARTSGLALPYLLSLEMASELLICLLSLEVSQTARASGLALPCLLSLEMASELKVISVSFLWRCLRLQEHQALSFEFGDGLRAVGLSPYCGSALSSCRCSLLPAHRSPLKAGVPFQPLCG